MMTKSQQDLMDTFLLSINESFRPLYQDILDSLLEFGYRPKKEKTAISFKHSQHNKQIAKMGIKSSKKHADQPYFALRFSACNVYSQRFSDIVAAAIIKNPSKTPGCKSGSCNYCAGLPDTHVYKHTFADAETKFHCGAYVLEIPNLAPEGIQEIKKMIAEEHAYLMEHEAKAR